MKSIFAVGETILDIIFRDGQPRAARPGGSSFNTAISLGRLKAPVTFISEMGNDRVGDIICDFMVSNGVKTDYISRYEEGQSAIALAFLNKESDAEYQFYKDYPHQRLNVDFPEFLPDDLLMFGSYYALQKGIRPRVRELLEKARQQGATLVYDPNFRDSHADERDLLIGNIRENMAMAHIVRASDEDMSNIFGSRSADESWETVKDLCDIFIYTSSAQTVSLRTHRLSLDLPVQIIEPLSTIGAGDTFNAGILYGIYTHGYRARELNGLDKEHWEELLGRAMTFSREVCLSYDNYLPEEFAERITKDPD